MDEPTAQPVESLPTVERERAQRPRWVPRAVWVLGSLVIVAALVAGVWSWVSYVNRPDVTPDLVGMTSAEAATYLEQQGFESGSVVGRRSSRPRGEVVSQSPSPGAPLPRGAAVDVYVSVGDDMTVVPEVVGQGLRSAVGRLETAGIRYEIDHELSSEASGTVLSVDPGQGSVVSYDRVVRLVVAMDAVSLEHVVPFDLSGLTVAINSPDVPGQRRDVLFEISSRLEGLLLASGATVVQGRTPASIAIELESDMVRERIESADPFVAVLFDVRGDAEAGPVLEHSASPQVVERSADVAQRFSALLGRTRPVVKPVATDAESYLGGTGVAWIRYVIGNFRIRADQSVWAEEGYVDDVARAAYLSIALAADRDLLQD